MIPTNPLPSVPNPKILPSHLDRWAIVYVRQSQPQQIYRHRESALVQANLRQRALAWGWPQERIRVLDGDQGRSGTTTAGRDDFAWLLSEIALGHVGLVLGFQINRLAREDEAICRLIKVCAAFDTLLADQDGLYHPHDFNDRLILTVKGLMGGFELHQLQQRMQAGRLNRARRGEWLGQPPPGYVKGPDGKLQFDPDELVQHVVRLILDQFAILGSVSGVLAYLHRHHLQLPFRPASGPQQGQLQWHSPHRETVRKLLRHPAYAGAYTWGRYALDPRRVVAGQRGRGRVERAPQECAVFLPDNHAAYLSWEQYQSNLRRLREQRRRGPVPGSAPATVALLCGRVVCGVCGSRMQTQYTRGLRYECQRRLLDYAAPRCQSLVGEPVEQLLDEQVLRVVEPASLELSLEAVRECERERAALDRQWRLRVERARQEAERAARQYQAVEPENRLVARTLERAWEEALRGVRSLEEEYDRFRQTQPVELSVREREEIRRLAADLPAVWRAAGTSVEDKRRVVGWLVEKVVVWAPWGSERVRVEVHWSGGAVTEHEVRRRVGSWGQVEGVEGLVEQVQKWRGEGRSSGEIAEALNRQGQRTPRGKEFTGESVRQLLARRGGERGAGKEPRKGSRRGGSGGEARRGK
jgi:DNA invertase Pin-like site-specific DNA recombinase